MRPSQQDLSAYLISLSLEISDPTQIECIASVCQFYIDNNISSVPFFMKLNNHGPILCLLHSHVMKGQDIDAIKTVFSDKTTHVHSTWAFGTVVVILADESPCLNV